ncbi:replication protein A 70 kDa DNA-binding subunit B [Artemisia annua]|uniref:Replication protein A 70 kDa DNA-binding subunit B n=1 Tax=Artemisia annua TaxID=35608 RepID=A0A2U1LI05_ARTAN|nr:replication protein A 70 kDa DNA-binding subunit B [Artemisia annua]
MEPPPILQNSPGFFNGGASSTHSKSTFSISMAVFVSGYINDLSAVKDNITLRVRVLRSWTQVIYNKPHVKNLEMILLDENNTKMQATCRMANVNQFKHKLVEGAAVKLERYSLGKIQPKYRMVNNALHLSFLSNTLCEPCTDFTGSMYGFDFRGYKSITDLQMEEDGQFDVIGHVTACQDLDNFDKNGNKGKKKPLTLIDAEGNELNCTLWGVFAQQFNDFLEATVDHGKIMIVLSLAMMKSWDGKMCVQNGYQGTKLQLFNAAQPIEQAEFKEVEEYRLRLFSREDAEPSENTASRISAGSKFSTKDDFLNKYPVKNIVELLDVEKNIASVIVGTIIAIQEEKGWWYLGCRKCSKKVVKECEFVDLDDDSKGKMSVTSDQWRCTKCNKIVKGIKSIFRLQVRVQDESGTMSLSLFNDEVQSLTGRSAYQLCEKYGLKSADQQVFPKEITELVGKRFAFKVSIDEYNQKKMLPVFTVLRLSADVDILSALTSSVTPMKEAEATSSKCVGISALDLESQTDETVTPTNVLKSTATSPPAKTSSGKRPSDDGPSTECSKTKRQIEVLAQYVLVEKFDKLSEAQNDQSDKKTDEGKKVECDKEDGAENKYNDRFDDVVGVDEKKTETKIILNMEPGYAKAKLFEPDNSTYYDSDDSIDSYILKSIMEENCCCPVCSGTCKCPPGECECSYCSPPTP